MSVLLLEIHLFAGLWSPELEGILGGVGVGKNVPTPTLAPV
jgi:hypothetical protein